MRFATHQRNYSLTSTTITAIALAQPQFILVGRPCRASPIEIVALPRAVIWMNERKALKSLLPLFTSKAEVIECNAVDIKTFAIRSVYRNNVWRGVQYLPELHFLLCLPGRMQRSTR